MNEETDKKYKIIIVDDDDFLVQMYATKFNNSNVSVDTCSSGVALLDKLRNKETADLILLDIVMPEFSGIDVLAKMKEEKLGENIPIVMLTNQNDEKDIATAKKFGVEGYIVKSAATPSEVVAEVLNIIKSSKS